jgi:putative ABC transport system ATP-binding protein
MIQLRQVERCYETGAERLHVLRRIDLDIAEGDFITIMGPSGAGKTTLLSVLGLLDANWSGEYRFLDQDVHRLSPKQRAALSRNHIGFVFQRYHLLDDLTVSENLDLPLSYQNVPTSRRRSMVCDVLDRFQIVAKKDLYPSQLSGGQQQLVGIARAVIAEPTLLLADEPTGNLHSVQGEEIMQLFKRLNDEGTTIVQVTHSEHNAKFSHRIVQLADGWIT